MKTEITRQILIQIGFIEGLTDEIPHVSMERYVTFYEHRNVTIRYEYLWNEFHYCIDGNYGMSKQLKSMEHFYKLYESLNDEEFPNKKI